MSERFSQISYQLIKRVLIEKLGFEMLEVDGRYYIFTHPETDTIFTLPILPHRKNLALMNYRTIYNILDKRGIMSQEAFKALLKTLQKQEKYNNEPVATSLNIAKAA
jgi:predicted RNA binding protein YcfA (HicA-like mRNA interferase family)